MATEIEDTLKRIHAHKGVVGTIIVNSEGIPIKTSLDNATTVQYAGLISQLSDKARSVVRDLDPTNDLTFLRVRSKNTKSSLLQIENSYSWSYRIQQISSKHRGFKIYYIIK